MQDNKEAARLAFQRPWPTTRRGAALWLFGAVVAMVGVFNYIITDITDNVPGVLYENLAFILPLTNWALWPWGVLLVIVGLISMGASYCHFGRDKIGYTILSSFCASWSTVHLMSFVFFGAGTIALGSTLIWAVFATVLIIVAGFPNVTFNQPPMVVLGDQPGDDKRTVVGGDE